ncbi:MAG: sterol desaturase family protein [Nitrospirota bacterium]
MNMFVIDNEVYIRLGFFFGIFIFMSMWETTAPRRALTQSKGTRWFHNLILTTLNSILVRLIFPAAAVGAALVSSEHGWGLFNNVELPEAFAGITAVIVLDLIIYAQHFYFHKIALFWRLHRMHHTDLDVDVTTGARFHPVEIILSMAIKMLAVIILGAPVWSVVAFEVFLNATSMFNHSNVYMNERIDKVLRLLVVTPDMHRVHHSVIIKETDSNFGFNLSWWDRLFRTYTDQPFAGHKGMKLGLANYRDKKWLTLPWMLAVPFAGRER